MQHLGTAIAPPSDVQTTKFLGQASSPVSGDRTQLAARGPAAIPGGRAVETANGSRFYIMQLGHAWGSALGHSRQCCMCCNF